MRALGKDQVDRFVRLVATGNEYAIGCQQAFIIDRVADNNKLQGEVPPHGVPGAAEHDMIALVNT